MYKTFGIFAHVDAGKTTFAELLLYHSHAIRAVGNVNDRNTVMDYHELEIERKITIFSEQYTFCFHDSIYCLIDTPGHSDFSSDMERSISIIDYAIILINASSGVEANTLTIFEMLKSYQKPIFFFINKTDLLTANLSATIDDIKTKLTGSLLSISHESIITPDVMEFLAEQDDFILEKYLEGETNEAFYHYALKAQIKQRLCFPVMSGSALYDQGISEFWSVFHQLTDDFSANSFCFKAQVYKVRYYSLNERVTFLKILQGTLHIKEEFLAAKELETKEKIHQIRFYHGQKYDLVPEAAAGALVGVTGLKTACAGDILENNCILSCQSLVKTHPVFSAKVCTKADSNIHSLLNSLRLLEEEDPSLHIRFDTIQKEIYIEVMGQIQLEILSELLKRRFSHSVYFDKPNVLYKETITDVVRGCGHFEPLRHYAEVILSLSPNTPGSGITFESQCPTDILSISYQKAIAQAVKNPPCGILTGSPLTDIHITLLNGRAHIKHTEGGDFREATFRAIRQGIEKANCILMEPYYQFKIYTPAEYLGRILSDIQKMYGTFDSPEQHKDQIIVCGSGPVSTFCDYSLSLQSISSGKSYIHVSYGGYHPCHNPVEVIEKKAYQKESDTEYSSSSVFCSKGQSFSVSWDKAEDFMHCLK